MIRKPSFLIGPLALTAALLSGCSDESDDKAPGSGSDAGANGGASSEGGVNGGGNGTTNGGGDSGGGGSTPECGECATIVEPSDDDTETLQAALIDADSGDVIGLAPGEYAFTREISLSDAQNITLRGLGESRQDVVLDFADQTVGDDGVVVTADGFTIEHMWIKNTPGNGIVVQADDSTFRNLKVSWDAGSVTENGAYAVYPTNCNRTIIEDSEVIGAADAGIYVGQCNEAIVRRNEVHANVAGIEIENTITADVYENEVYDNTGGILVLLLPNKQMTTSADALVRDNVIRDNNRENFGEEGTTVAAIPPGTGMIVIGASDTEIRNNEFTGNSGAPIVVVSLDILDILQNTMSTPDPNTDRYPKRTYIYDNTYENNGTEPQGAYSVIGGQMPITAHVLWDGIVDPDVVSSDAGAGGDAGVADAGAGDGGSPDYGPAGDAAMQLCLGTPEKDAFLNFAADRDLNQAAMSTDSTPHECTLEPLPELQQF